MLILQNISYIQPELVLLDEPSNHLDATGRELLDNFIRSTAATVIVVSHDRTLLKMLDKVCELSKRGMTAFRF